MNAGAYGVQKRATDPLELESQVDGDSSVGAGI